MTPRALLVSPNLVVQRNDRFTTGVVYMPIGLAYVASSLRRADVEVQVVDAFGEAPTRARVGPKFQVMGLPPDEVAARVRPGTTAAFVYANQLINHDSVVDLIRALKARAPAMPVVVLENTQAVTAYALPPVAKELFAAGADYLLPGEAEHRAPALVRALHEGAKPEALAAIEGLSTKDRLMHRPEGYLEDLDALPFPAWDLFPVQGYWSLGFAHGPLTSDRYLPLLTSRGCPYPCKFCVVPSTNTRAWRARSAKNVVDELEHWVRTLGVREFHVEDLNPTINDGRTRAICKDIIARGLDVTWKLAAGTKVESIKDEETVDLMAKAGCRYISISPESGSAKVLKLIDKPFKDAHAVRLIQRMNQVGIRSQACFVLGFPGEDDADRALTRAMVHDLTRAGVDEVALFIVSPVPGSEIFPQYSGYGTLSDLNFTPSWRADYPALARFRLKLYSEFLLWKLRYHPLKVARQALNFSRRRFETKMEMVPYKALRWRGMESSADRS